MKHQLDSVKELIQADEYFHIGDTDLDRHYSERAGFSFLSLDVGLTPLFNTGLNT